MCRHIHSGHTPCPHNSLRKVRESTQHQHKQTLLGTRCSFHHIHRPHTACPGIGESKRIRPPMCTNSAQRKCHNCRHSRPSRSPCRCSRASMARARRYCLRKRTRRDNPRKSPNNHPDHTAFPHTLADRHTPPHWCICCSARTDRRGHRSHHRHTPDRRRLAGRGQQRILGHRSESPLHNPRRIHRSRHRHNRSPPRNWGCKRTVLARCRALDRSTLRSRRHSRLTRILSRCNWAHKGLLGTGCSHSSSRTGTGRR